MFRRGWLSLWIVILHAFVLVNLCLCIDFDENNIGIANGAQIVCYADVNSDKQTDIITVTYIGDKSRLEIYFYNSHDYKLNQDFHLLIDGTIVNVAATDFNYDGIVDILVQINPDNSYPGLINHIYIGELYQFNSNPIVIGSSLDHLLLFDYNNDLLTDLYGVSNTTQSRSIWLNTNNKDNNQLSFNTITHNVTLINPYLYNGLAVPNSNSFIDINGDCLADLFIVSHDSTTDSKHIEIWLNSQKDGYHLYSYTIARPNMGIIYWFDIDSDGTLDMIYPVIDHVNHVNELHIFYNQQKPMCSNIWDTTSDTCRAQQDLCSPDNHFYFDSFDSTQPTQFHIVLTGQLFAPYEFNDNIKIANKIDIPFTIHANDVNRDGFIDLLLPMVNTNDPNDKPLSLFMNSGCNNEYCVSSAVDSNRRIFERDGFNIGNGIIGTFIDIGNQGKLDIVASVIDSNNGNNVITKSFTNNNLDDSYFLTTLTSNGNCPSWCPDPLPKFPSPKPYGTNTVGATVKFTLTSLTGTKYQHVGAQLSSSSYYSLQLPYIYFGLGRTNNYIEELFVGIPYNSNSNNYNMWVAMIPNSQIVIFPYPPDEPDNWTIELFISPSSRLLNVCISVVTALAINAAIIAYLYWREKQADEREKRKNEQLLFTF